MTSSYHLEDRGKCNKNACINPGNVPKLRFKGYNDEWKGVKLKNICSDFIVPMRDKPKEFNGNIPWCRIEDIEGNYFHGTKSNQYVSQETIDVMNLKIIPTGSVICSCSASLGTYAINTRPIITNQTFIGLVCSDKISNHFLLNLMHTQTKKLRIIAGGTTIPYISREKFEEYNIKIPNKDEQEKIASFLTLIDKKIEKQKELVELLKKYKRGLLSAIFSQKLRFKDDNGNDYPAWVEKSLGDVTNNISYGLNAASKDYDGENKYIRITDIDETTGKYNNLDIVSPDCALSDDYKLKINDLLFARTGAGTGKTYLYNENDGKMYFAGFLIKFSIKDEYCSNFIFYITQTFNYKKWVSIMSARSGQPGINAKEYSNYKFSCPVYDEQVKISNIISKLDNIIEKENILLDSYNDYKKGLLQKMFI